MTGVLLDPDSRNGDPEFVAADLVVDAAGRGTRLPVWLTQWGYQRPVEETVDIGISYATHQFRIPDGLIREKVVVAGASHDESLGLGMLYYEDGTWVLTTFGVANAKPPRTFPEMLALARPATAAHFNAALAHAEPFGEPAFHAFPASKWRRYDKLERFPVGIVPFGDAVASFNPTFGQGMTMTSLQAGHLRRALGIPRRQASRRTQSRHRQDDLSGVDDERDRRHHLPPRRGRDPIPWWWRPSGALFDQFLGAAETEPVLAEWFLRRFSLLDSLYMIPSPRSSVVPCGTTCGCGSVRNDEQARTNANSAARLQPDRRPEQLGGSRASQPDRAVVGPHPGGHAAVQRQRPGFAVHRRGTLGCTTGSAGPSWRDDASTSWPRYSPSSTSSATANSSAGVS